MSLEHRGRVGWSRRREWQKDAPRFSIAIAVLILLASISSSRAGTPHPEYASTGTLPFPASLAAFRPASMGFSAAQVGEAQAFAASPNYDEQVGATFTQDLPALTYNVTALAQVDADGYGPAYILNGLTGSGYWYQVGISYHWPSSNGAYDPTFGFSYQVYGPAGKPVFPTAGGAGLGTFSKAVHSGDSVLLSLIFSGLKVQMVAQDWDTGAMANTSYSGMGSSSFVGNPSRPSSAQGFFTGVMTEWYHLLPSSGNEGKVTYTDQAHALSSAWLWIDEFVSGSSGSPIFSDKTQNPVVFANAQQLYPFASHGVTIYGSAHQFITGLLNTTSSRVSLIPATPDSVSPTFAATYTLGGSQQTSQVAAGPGSLVAADPGTTVTISLNSSGSTTLDAWVFSVAGGSAVVAVTFAAGSNVTYVYYHLDEETVAYQVAAGGKPPPAASAPELIYEVPPGTPSATPTPVAASQLLGTSPVNIFAIQGSDVRLNVSVAGATGERWAADSQDWSVSAPDSIPYPIQLYDQYQVSIGYSIVGGGTPPEQPTFNATSLGSPDVISLSGKGTTGWFDARSGYSFSGLLNGTTPAERWVNSLAGNPVGGLGQGIISPNQALMAAYVHQYYADFGVNDARGGQLSRGSAWADAGVSLNASASANAQWQFESWKGTGAGAYTGTIPSIDVTVAGPITENATFYAQLSIAADKGTDIAFSYESGAGTVQAGSTKIVYVPPSAKVTLSASPSSFVYAFASWTGTGLANATRPSLSFVVNAPSAVEGTSSYNLTVLLGGAATAAVIILAGSLLARGGRKRASPGDVAPAGAPGLRLRRWGTSLDLLCDNCVGARDAF